jgi:SP family galactose:H+ symporter-like MFS transporter
MQEDAMSSTRAAAAQSRLVFRIAGIAAMGGLLFGYDTGVISGALLFLAKQFHLSSLGQELVVSAVLVGCILGAAASGRLADRFGRRNLILVCAAVFLLGSLASALAQGVHSLIAGRVVIGLAIGVASFVVPLYISEISPPHRRGALVSLNQLMITVGIVVSYLVDDLFAQADQGWRYMFLLGVAPALILGIGMMFLPRSPRWLVLRQRDEEARLILEKTVGPDQAQKELAAMHALEHAAANGAWSDLAAPWLRPALLIGLGIMLVQQATGINTVIYYAPTIFKMSGFASNTAAISATVGVGVINVLFTVVSIKLLDRWGRKPLLTLGLLGMVTSLLALGLVFALEKSLGDSIRWLAVASVGVYIASFAVSLGPIAWLLISEVYPMKIRGLAMSLATLANWFINFLVAISFLSIIDLLGKTGAFWLYAAVGLAGLGFCRWYVPETKGVALERIEANLKAGRKARDLGAA